MKYLPTTVPTMKRAKAGGHKGAIKQVIDAPIDVEVRIDSLVNLVVFACINCVNLQSFFNPSLM